MNNKKIVIISVLLFVFVVGTVTICNTPHRRAKFLVKAIREEDYDEVEKLLNEGVDPNIPTASDIEEFILNIVETGRERPLSVACNIGNLELIKLLIDYGATAEQNGKCGWSPLRETLFFYKPNDVEIVKILLDNGAEPDFVENGQLPVFIAADMMPRVFDKNKANGTVWASDYDVESAKGITEIVCLLLGDKSVNIKTKSGETLLMKAVQRENIYLVEYLISAGCDIEMKDSKGMTALDYAKKTGNKSIIALLS